MFTPTGVTKKDYLDIMEKVVDSYGTKLLEEQLELPDNIYHFTAFRTSVMLAYLIESGRRPELLPLWKKATEKGVQALAHCSEAGYSKIYNDLTLEELCVSFIVMKDYVKPEWLEVLGKADAETHYELLNPDSIDNIVVYGCVGQYLREKLTGKSCDKHFDKFMPQILKKLDENGMFQDHDLALLYDLTTRVRLEQLLWWGYDGKWAKDIERAMEKAADTTLLMQSAAFQIPFGGRSNQFLHNEALQTSFLEYAAIRAKKKGDMKKAGQCKRAAHLSMQTIKRFIDLPGGAKHIRNEFPQDCLFGIDTYGTFIRYMNALSTFIACGYLAADDTIPESPCPAELGGYVFSTTKPFGKIFAAACGQSVEYAVFAERTHEAPGLGRYHANSTPADLGLTMPFTENPKYILSHGRIPFDVIGPKSIADMIAGPDSEFTRLVNDVSPSRNLAISPGYFDESGKRKLFCDGEKPNTHEVISVSDGSVSFRVHWDRLAETFTLDKDGLHIYCEAKDDSVGKLFWAIPMLSDNGHKKEITCSEHKAEVKSDGATYSVSSSGKLTLSDETTANRNGIYRVLYADASSATLKLSKD